MMVRIGPPGPKVFADTNISCIGCLIVELEDHRDSPEKPSKERIVLPMDAESLWTDIRLEQERSGKITTEEEALDLESRLLVRD